MYVVLFVFFSLCLGTDYRCIAEPGSYYFVARDEYNIPVTASSTVEAEKACYESGGSRVAQIPRACSSGFTAYLREDYGWGQDAIANVTFGFDLSDDPTDWGAKTMVVCERKYIQLEVVCFRKKNTILFNWKCIQRPQA